MDPVSMTSAAVGWLMSSLVDKAVTALLEAWAELIGLGNEFKTLKDQLLQLGSLLTSARRLRTDNNFLEELVQDLQQLAYRAENLLDELDYYRLQDEIQQRGSQEKVNCINKSSVASPSSSFRLASRSILLHLKRISRRFVPYALVEQPKTSSSRINLSRRMNELAKQLKKSEEKVRNVVQTESLVFIARNTEISQTDATNLRQTSSFLTEPNVFGRDQERDQLMNLLTNEESAIVGKVPVLAIVGTGGVGKTTLARLVFNDPKVHSYFEVRSWICVSHRFDIDRLTREMLEGSCGNRCDLTNLNELQNKLKNELGARRFLLVLDDMWEDKDRSQWDSIVAPLNYCSVEGSIILVTTRNQSVAEMVQARDNIYLQGLDDNAFLSFFSTCIFNDPNYGGNWRLKKVGQEIAKKLKGNPLAAKTVSALLKEKLDERYWMEIRDSEEWKFQRGPNDIMPALWLSYEHMPFHLQRCFSYCAMFPEDHHFTCKEMVYLWMAQSFLDTRSEGKRMTDIGRAYFNDLVTRGFLQTTQSKYGGKDYYTFHDLIHDLAHVVAFKECLTVNGPEPRKIPRAPTIRHLSISYTWGTKEAELEEAIIRASPCLEGENLSTVLLISSCLVWKELPSGILLCILDLIKKAKFLRAVSLDLYSSIQLENFNFENFVSLRYLRLIFSADTTCNSLPREICRLYHLEVFEIKDRWKLVELPNNFSDLVSLRLFIVDEMVYYSPRCVLTTSLHSKIRGVGKLTSLQKLNDFSVQQKKGFEIEQLGSLKEIGGSLHIWNLQNVKSKREASNARLAEKEKLDALYLRWDHGEQENESVLESLKPNTNLKRLYISGYGGVASPTWLEPSLIFLESLILEYCKAWKVLPPIGELEFLKNLQLSRLAVREIGPQCYGTRQSMKFPSLENLEIIDMPDLEKWVWSDQLQQFVCFERLKTLTIKGCPKLVDFPLSRYATSEVLERFPSLKSLKIEECPLIFQPPPIPYSSLLSNISISPANLESSLYLENRQDLILILNQNSSLKLGELLAFHEFSSLRSLKISHISSMESFHENLVIPHLRILEISLISSLESLDLHSFVALEELYIRECQSLTSLTLGDHLARLKILRVTYCKALSSMNGLKSWVNLKELHFYESPGFIAAWDSESKEIEKTEPNFSLPLREIEGDCLDLLTLPICKQLTSLQTLFLQFKTFTEGHNISQQLLTSIDLVDIRGCKKNLQTFPFDLFPSLNTLWIQFPRIRSLPTDSQTEITKECLKLRNIVKILISESPVKILLILRTRGNDVPADGCG